MYSYANNLLPKLQEVFPQEQIRLQYYPLKNDHFSLLITFFRPTQVFAYYIPELEKIVTSFHPDMHFVKHHFSFSKNGVIIVNYKFSEKNSEQLRLQY